MDKPHIRFIINKCQPHNNMPYMLIEAVCTIKGRTWNAPLCLSLINYTDSKKRSSAISKTIKAICKRIKIESGSK